MANVTFTSFLPLRRGNYLLMLTLAKNSNASSSDRSSPTLPSPSIASASARAQVSADGPAFRSREFDPESSDVDFCADPLSLGWQDDPRLILPPTETLALRDKGTAKVSWCLLRNLDLWGDG